MTKCTDCDQDAYVRGFCRLHYQRRLKDGSITRVNVQRRAECAHKGCREVVFAKGFCGRHYKETEHPLKNLWRMLRSRDKGNYPPAWDQFEAFLAAIGERPGERHQLRRLNSRLPWAADNLKWLAPLRSKYQDNYTKEYRADYQRDWHLRSRFGISKEQYDEMLMAQDGLCAVCREREAFVEKSGKIQDLSVDHDHQTNEVRGLLCVGCNRGIGYFRDSPDRLRAAAAYLERHAKPPTETEERLAEERAKAVLPIQRGIVAMWNRTYNDGGSDAA